MKNDVILTNIVKNIIKDTVKIGDKVTVDGATGIITLIGKIGIIFNNDNMIFAFEYSDIKSIRVVE